MQLIEMTQALANKTQHIPYRDGFVAWHEFGQPISNRLPLILLHGGHGSWEHWARNVEVLAEHFHVFVPDMPGFGESTYFDSQFQPGMIEPMIATMNTLLGENQLVNIAGFSFGGFVAAHLANQRKQISKLALLGSAGHGGPRRPRGELLAWREIQASGDTQRLSEVMRENLYLQMISTYDRIDSEAIRIHQDACIATSFKSKPIARPGGLAEQLEQFPGPILLIWGEHDITCTPEYLIENLVSGWGNRSKELVIDAGHWVQYERPDQINASLIRWFE
jgi:2-hydroxy-6-oxonona-2,4-dienedioate hydrolase